MESTPVVGWIGLGSMGKAMAKNIQNHLATSSRSLMVYNRTASKCVEMEDLGAKPCSSISELASACDAIFISSSDDTAVQAIIEQIVASGDINGKCIIDTTTIHPDSSKSIAAILASSGAYFAALPVFGASPVAEEGKLLAAFAGPDAVWQVVFPLLKGVIAREVLVVGTEPEKGTLLKTTGNLLMASLMQIIAEAHVFAEKSGLPANMLERLLELNFGTVMHSDSVRMTTGVYCPGAGQSPWSAVELAIKDVGHGIKIGERHGVSLRTGNAALTNLQKAKEWSISEQGRLGNGLERRLDSSSLFGVIRQESGLNFETELVKERDGRER